MMRIQLRTFLVLTTVAGVFIQSLRPVAAQSRAVFAAADGGDQDKDWSAAGGARNVAAALLTSALRIVVA